MPATDLRRLYALAPRYDALRDEAPLGRVPDDGACIDGPGIAYWLIVVEGASYRELSATAKRRLRSWLEGSAATVAAVDRVLCEASVPLSLIPAGLIVAKRRFTNHANRLSDEQRAEAVARYRRGGKYRRDALIRELCTELGVVAQTVWRWSVEADRGDELEPRKLEAVGRWREIHRIEDHTELARHYGVSARTLRVWSREDAGR